MSGEEEVDNQRRERWSGQPRALYRGRVGGSLFIDWLRWVARLVGEGSEEGKKIT